MTQVEAAACVDGCRFAAQVIFVWGRFPLLSNSTLHGIRTPGDAASRRPPSPSSKRYSFPADWHILGRMPFPLRLVLAACALALLPGSRLVAQASPSGINSIPRSDDYVLQAWDRQGGLPYLDIKDITQTPDGYLWIATYNGLVRFDGAQFTTIPESSGLDPISTSILLTAKDGMLWVGFGHGGLARLCKGRFEVVVPSTSDPNRWIQSLAEDGKGGIWAAFFHGDAIRWQPAGLQSFTLPAGERSYVSNLYSAIDGSLWFSTSEDFGFFENGAFRSFPTTERQYVHLAVARQGGMWALRGQLLSRIGRDGK
ncbi:MAG TPA: two-component regulator propeller domain-containing protein, partial [Chthoniobacterales bacterium]